MNRLKKTTLSIAAIATPIFTQAADPNVILIVVDDMGWKDLQIYGSDFHKTPAIDQLAADGVLFTDAYAACTVSSPTRASLMTGKYPAKLHLTDWIEGWKMPEAKLQVPDWTMYLPAKEITMADLFKRAGYKTIHIGKWHLGENPEYWPENNGFDVNIGGWSKGSPFKNEKEGYNGYFTPYGNPRLKDGPQGEYLTERLASEACNFIGTSTSQPFFLNLWFYNVHTPLQAKQNKIDYYAKLSDDSNLQKNPVYAAMVEHVDDAVKRVINVLKEKGLYDNTLIILTSDNGGLIGRGKNKITNNTPLRSGKGDIYEGGVRVPLIIKNLHQQQKGEVNHSPVISIDFLPTLVDMVRLPATREERKDFDGVSLKSLLTGKTKKLKRDAIFWHYPHYHIEGATPYSAVRYGDWKLINTFEENKYELYNLKEDIGERKDVASQNPGITKKLTKELDKWRKNMKAQMPTVNPNVKSK
ncbi:sulfatase [Proteiniphilum sp. UBA5384]|jgi:arylsulfatase A-like enzyme|uniref:sulfatase n=1 Tax=Proteiniphilum sp. UBA5384 TaxID=1947279 RepID=UPI0025FA615A|nr:sulfatase [Proteiniphilum sp. UBA5384]